MLVERSQCAAGAVLAAVGLNVRTELSMGPRSGFDQVKPGNSYQVSVDIQDIRVINQARSIRLFWHEHAYSEAAEQFRMLPRSELSTSIMASINRQQALSMAFGMWDRFLHQDAQSELSRYTKLFGKWLGPWLKTLDDLTNNNKPERQELFLIHDLWLNAERVALRHRFDDAVSKAYRFLEWVVQNLLRQRHSVDNSDVTQELIPEATSAPSIVSVRCGPTFTRRMPESRYRRSQSNVRCRVTPPMLTWAQGVFDNLARRLQGNDRARLVKAVYEGGCDIAIINNYYFGKLKHSDKPDKRDWAAAVDDLIFPNQDDRGTHVNISGGGGTASPRIRRTNGGASLS